jgi:4-alpha-glucanotransferase
MQQERQIMQQEILLLDTELGSLKQDSELIKQEKLQMLVKTKALIREFDQNKLRAVIGAYLQSEINKLNQERNNIPSQLRATTVDF